MFLETAEFSSIANFINELPYFDDDFGPTRQPHPNTYNDYIMNEKS